MFILSQLFSTYRRIFAVIFPANLATFVALGVKSKGTPLLNDIATASSANLTLAILFRQEDLINLCYEVFCSASLSLPFFIWRRLAKFFHYGGAHSGAGMASAVWFLLYTALITRDWLHNQTNSNLVNFILCYVVLATFIIILGAAHPQFQ